MKVLIPLSILMVAMVSAVSAAPINQPMQAILRLRTAKTDTAQKTAVKDVVAACRGKLRHSLRDHAGLKKEAGRWGAAKSAETRKASLDLEPCFTPKAFAPLVAARFVDADHAVVSYAAEVAARLADPAILPALLEQLEARKTSCLKDELSKPEVEHCVWFSYAPSSVLVGAPEDQRKKAAELGASLFKSPHAKVREVAVETVAAAKLKDYASAVRELIAQEKKGAFTDKNSKALLKRFKKRAKALSRN